MVCKGMNGTITEPLNKLCQLSSLSDTDNRKITYGRVTQYSRGSN